MSIASHCSALDVHSLAKQLWLFQTVAFLLKTLGKKLIWREILCDEEITHRLCNGEPGDGLSFSFSQQNQDCLINVNFYFQLPWAHYFTVNLS